MSANATPYDEASADASKAVSTPVKTKSLSVGERLKHVRERAGLSQRELARRAELTNGTLSNIEQDKVSPAIASLEKILNAIPMSMQAFFAEDFATSASVYRIDQFVEINKDTTHYRILPLDLASEGAYLAMQTYGPGAVVSSEWMVRNGTIAGIVVSGTLDLVLDGVKYRLDAGEGFYFAIHRPHSFKNVSAKPCQVVCVSLGAKD